MSARPLSMGTKAIGSTKPSATSFSEGLLSAPTTREVAMVAKRARKESLVFTERIVANAFDRTRRSKTKKKTALVSEGRFCCCSQDWFAASRLRHAEELNGRRPVRNERAAGARNRHPIGRAADVQRPLQRAATAPGDCCDTTTSADMEHCRRC